jgi:hypothetical protein
MCVYDMWLNDLVKNDADPNYIKQVKRLLDLFKQQQRSLRFLDNIVCLFHLLA